MYQISASFVVLKNLLHPVLASVTLIASACYYQGRFGEGYFALLVLSFLLTGQLVDGVDLLSNNKTFWKKTVINLLMQWCWVIGFLLLIGFASKVTDYFSRLILITWFVITPFFWILAQCLFRALVRQWAVTNGNSISAVIVGVNELSLKLTQKLQQNPLLRIHCEGYFDDRELKRLEKTLDHNPVNLLGKINEIADYCKNKAVQQIYITLPMTAQPRILALLDDLRDTTASVYFVPDIFVFDLIQAQICTIQGIPIITVCESPFTGVNGALKRLMDIVLSLLILLLISPLMLIIALGVKLSSPGPVLFKQRRYGLDGKEIYVYKFRSMKVMEDGAQITQASKQDPRVTRFGNFIRKTSLDELPQFINVLQGRMSIVGPRPHAVSHNEMYRSLIKGYMIRHKVKPGITGWAQVNGFRGETDTLEKMQKRIDFDLDYLRNWSLFLDLLIIVKTTGVIFKDNNAY